VTDLVRRVRELLDQMGPTKLLQVGLPGTPAACSTPAPRLPRPKSIASPFSTRHVLGVGVGAAPWYAAFNAGIQHPSIPAFPPPRPQETDALNLTAVPRPKMDMRLDDFSIEVEEDAGSKWYVVRGPAVERFAQMTNWDYYEAVGGRPAGQRGLCRVAKAEGSVLHMLSGALGLGRLY
jgi:hypothetical protein